MEMQDFTLTIPVSASPAEAFRAINNVTEWWTENLHGNTHNEGDDFTVQFGDVHYSKHRLTEVVPDKKVVWLTTEGRLNFTHDPAE